MSIRECITCTHKSGRGLRFSIADIGFNAQGTPVLYIWCRTHRQFHECMLEQLLERFHTLSANDEALRKNYTTLLSEAIVRCYVL